jgi:spore coat protein CotH
MLWVLLSCQPPVEDTEEPTASLPDSEAEVRESEPPESEPPVVDSEEPEPEPVVTEETLGDQELDDSWIFDNWTIHDVAITLPEESVGNLSTAPYQYTEASLSFDGIEMDPIGVRLRGKIGSFRALSGKPKFKLDLNQYVEDQRLYGLETLSLNNSVVDCSYMKEAFAYRLFEAAGVMASRQGWARVTVNGEPYGLYVMIETPDDAFLKRAYEDPTGNLYDGKYVWYGGYNYVLLDFAEGHDTMFQLEEGTDVGHADIVGVSSAIFDHAGQSTWYAETGKVVDWDQFHMEWAVSQWVGQNDGYELNSNNYRVYFDPGSGGRAHILPWDFDYSFLVDSSWGRSWAAPEGRLAYFCMADAECQAGQKAAVEDLLAITEAMDLTGFHDEMVALIAEDVAADTRRECSDASVASEQARVRGYVESRDAALRAWWGL